jgi:hypothetical protein
MENKLKAFAGLPIAELTQVSDVNNTTDSSPEPRNVAQEFAETKQHTQSVQETPKIEQKTAPNDSTATNDTTTAKKNRLGKVMSGDFAVNLVDMMLPGIVVLIINRIGYALDKKDLQLTAKEKEALAPVVQDCLDDINLDFSNPWTNLMVMVGIVYGSKIIDKIPSMKKKEPSKEKQSASEKVSAIVSGTGESGEPISDFEKFEIDYLAVCDEIRKERKRGMPDAKEYLAINLPEKIKALARKHGIDLKQIHDKLGFRAPKKTKNDDFNMPQ